MEKSLEDEFSVISFSQEGEDLILARFFENKKSGFYVDVGAHHPVRFSNTYFFYKKGWNGINIDATPGSMKSFNEIRPRDINLEVAVSDEKRALDFYIFNEPALNTFSEKLAEEYRKYDMYELINKDILTTERLDNILEKYLPKNIKVDFLNVDVEGFDLLVLKSNNWDYIRPEFVLVEFLLFDIETFMASELYSFMKSKKYSFFSKTLNTVFFKADK